MAGYVFAIGGDTEIIRTCAERGIYSTRLNSLTSRPFEATLADYISMKPGDNGEIMFTFLVTVKYMVSANWSQSAQTANIQTSRIRQPVNRSHMQM